jgi:hypothetical protein
MRATRAVHLLSHGIWAFKVAGAGAATDLVYGEPLDTESMIIKRTTRALVLTERKRVTEPAQLHSKAAEAQRETDAYRSGILGDTELKGTRYVILVTKEDQEPPGEVIANGITHRHICIPVAPSVPSKLARRIQSTRQRDSSVALPRSFNHQDRHPPAELARANESRSSTRAARG